MKLDFRDSPLIDKQSDYMCCVSRFSTPLSQIPTIQECSFSIWKYDHASLFDNANHPTLPNKDLDTFDTVEEKRDPNNLVKTFNIPSAFSNYQFLDHIKKHLAQNIPNNHGGGTYQDGQTTIPLQFQHRVQIFCTPDMRFKVVINNDTSEDFIDANNQWYVQMDEAMFSMLQFVTGSHDVEYPEGNIIPGSRNATNLIGRKFFTAGNVDKHFLVQRGTPAVVTIEAGVHTAHMSASELSCHRRIVFESDVAVKSERNSTSSWKRFLCDYHITNPTSFSYGIRKRDSGNAYGENYGGVEYADFLSDQANVSEPLPSSRVYTSLIPSGGRWQELSLPSPLYSIEVTAKLEIWDYKLLRYRLTAIPLPAGALFDVKMVFVSKADPQAMEEVSSHFHK